MTQKLEPWQQRVVDEKKELDEKLSKLETFIGSDAFPKLFAMDQTHLLWQYRSMTGYSQVLTLRIARFTRAKEW